MSTFTPHGRTKKKSFSARRKAWNTDQAKRHREQLAAVSSLQREYTDEQLDAMIEMVVRHKK